MRGSTFDNSGSWVMKIIFANIIIYLLQSIYSPMMIYYFGLTPALVITKYYAWQLGTYMFLHGNFFHIFLNMYALMLFGIPVEQLWGTKKFVIYYFFTGIGAGITILIINLFMGGSGAFVPTIGASGAVFGLLLAFGILFPDVELLIFFFIPMKAKFLVILYGGIEFMSLLSSGTNSSVSHVGHLGGILFGLIFFLITRRKGIQFTAKKLKAKMGKEVKEREKVIKLENELSVEKLSGILEKLKSGGAEAITDDEYQFIKLADILYIDNDEICVQEDFNPEDGHCKKCDTMEACLMREIKKYL
ncbi:MAG TPA: rhomboid family intramembrane serine protease [Spirochaetota bacterium]|nr:rhomboid family intramembrane serine protease [Spirochaetota bacterium]HPS87182.1 rhomboid family intramembrane serine protease [Spirochaetota bacterium]